MSASEHYVYLHRRATDGSIFYVGKGMRKRAMSTHKRSEKWKSIADTCGVDVEIYKDNIHEECSLCIERILIFCAKQNSDLANLNDGGNGNRSGFTQSPETRAKISAAKKAALLRDPTCLAHLAPYQKGAKRSDETRAKQSAKKKGKPGPKMSLETRAKISASHMGMRPNAKTLKKLSESHIGKSCGRDSPTYDHALRLFSHANFGQFEGTRGDFLLKYNQAAGCVSELINGKRQSVKGWILL